MAPTGLQNRHLPLTSQNRQHNPGLPTGRTHTQIGQFGPIPVTGTYSVHSAVRASYRGWH